MGGDVENTLSDSRVSSSSASRLAFFPSEHRDFVSQRYTPRQQEFITSHLSGQDLAVVHSPEDYLVVALIHHMPSERLKKVEDMYLVLDFAHFMRQQRPWLNDERWFLGLNLHHEPTSLELVEDFNGRELGSKFRVYYVLKHISDPTKVRREQTKRKLLESAASFSFQGA